MGNIKTTRLLSLQMLRAVAAAMIVVLHAEALVKLYAEAHSYRFSPIEVFPLGAGVDLFFVISGFVIVYASNELFSVAGGIRDFMSRRLIRILPLYWTALSLRVIGFGAAAVVGAKVFPDARAIATSYLFIPYDAQGYGSNYLFPILDLGWTLNYEMFFYVVFVCFLGFSRDRAVFAFVAFICGIVTLASMLPPENDALRFWSQPIILEFALGSLIALAYFRGVTLSRITRLTLITLALVLWLTVPVSWFTDTSGPGFYSWTRLLIWGTGAVLIVAAAALGSTFIHSSLSRMIVSLGDSSYTLYLLHPFLFLLVKAALTKLAVPESLLWPLVFATAIFSIASAAFIYRLVEAPVLAYLRSHLPKRVGITPSSYYLRLGKSP